MQAMWQRAGTAFRAKVGKELSGHGLLYEDVLIETDEVKLALSRLPKDIMNQREIRLKTLMWPFVVLWVTALAGGAQARKTPSRPEVGPPSAFSSCVPTGMDGRRAYFGMHA